MWFNKYEFILVTILTIFLFSSSRALDQDNDEDEAHVRVKRNKDGYKDSVYKSGSGAGGSDSSRRISELMVKVDGIDSKLDKLDNQMKKTSDLLSYWTNTADIEESVYWKETSGCGGVIEAQAGRIKGIKPVIKAGSVECMWSILAGHRYRIKLTLRNANPSSSLGSTMTNCKVHEVKHNYDKSRDMPSFAITNLVKDKTYLFGGPLIFLTCYCNSYSVSTSNDMVDFDGIGPPVFPRVNFQHLHPQNLTGVYDVVTELNNDVNKMQLSDKDASFITITIPGQYHNADEAIRNVVLQSLSPDFCKSSSLSLHFDIAYPDDKLIVDCCKDDCLKHKFLLSKGYCVIAIGVNISTILERSSSSSTDFAKLAWDIQEHSKIKSKSEETCGGVISGRMSGRISETYSSYKPNSRCIWIIHPFPKTGIRVTLPQLVIEDEHEHLFAITVDDDANIETTRFTEEDVYYNLTGRVILIVFYSDTSLQMTGFSLTWEAIDSPTDLAVYSNDDKLYRYTERNGSTNWNMTMPPIWPGLHIGVINHFASYQPYSSELTMGYALKGSVILQLFGSNNGTFDLLANATMDTTTDVIHSNNYTSKDGVFLILSRLQKPQSSLLLDFQWNQGQAVAPTSYSTCGGRIEPAQHARIDFKTGKSLGSNTKCVWLIECRYSTVTFHLIKNGVKKYGMISIDTIDTQTGQILYNSTNRIDSATGDVVVSGPLILVTFASSSYTSLSTETGFELEYKGSGESINDGKKYKTRHWTALSSSVEYPLQDTESNDLLIFAQNPDATTVSTSDKLTVQFLSHALKNNTLGRGFNFSLYSFDVWNSNNTFQPAVQCTVSTGNLEDECNFLQSYIFADFHSESETFDMKLNHSGFLAVVKPLEDFENSESREFDLTWTLGGCGGLVSSPNGKIEYKMYQYYTSGEDCIWLVDGTKFGATSIIFNLEVSGILDRDYLNVYPISLAVGNIGTSTRLKYESSPYSYLPAIRNVTVPSGAALIAFRSSSLYSTTTGRGFRLAYTLRRARVKSQPQIPTGKTLIMFPNVASSSEVELPLKRRMTSLNHNDTVILFFNSPPTASTVTALSGSTTMNITIEDLNLFVNNKSCISDGLTFYYYSYASFYLKDSYRTFKNPDLICNETLITSTDYDEELESEHVPADDDEDLIYEEITSAPVPKTKTVKTNTCTPQCYDTNVLKTLTPARQKFQITPPFIVIYKSNSNHNETKRVRFSWTPKTALTSTTTDDDE